MKIDSQAGLKRFKPYLMLMRLNSIDIVLLPLMPAWCGIILANGSVLQTIYFLFLFLCAALVMRPAGCIINDILDRKFDAQVERTLNRPLASGYLNLSQALVLLSILLSVAFVILITTNITTVILGLLCLVITALYPLFKRFFWWPQLILGIAFNLGVLMGWSVIRDNVSLEAVLLYFGCVFWTVGYDTIYAHQDREDDIKLGLKSTAIYFKENTATWIKHCYTVVMMLWFSVGIVGKMNYPFYLAIVVIAGIFYYQCKKSDFDNPLKCMYMFRMNIWVGVLLFLGVLLGRC